MHSRQALHRSQRSRTRATYQCILGQHYTGRKEHLSVHSRAALNRSQRSRTKMPISTGHQEKTGKMKINMGTPKAPVARLVSLKCCSRRITRRAGAHASENALPAFSQTVTLCMASTNAQGSFSLAAHPRQQLRIWRNDGSSHPEKLGMPQLRSCL